MTNKVITAGTLLEVKDRVEGLGYSVVCVRQLRKRPHVLEIEFDVK